MAPSLEGRPGRYRLDVSGREAVAARVQLSFDDGCVGRDRRVLLEDEVEAYGGVIPVLVRELLIGISLEGGAEHLADGRYSVTYFVSTREE